MTITPTGVLSETDIPGPSIARLSSMPRVDLMPLEIAEGEAFRRLQLGCAAALVACGVAVGGLWLQAHSTVTSAKKNLAATQQEQAGVNAQVNKLASVATAYAAVENANALVQQALGGEVRWSTQLRDLSLSIPPHVWLTSMVIAPTSAAASTAPSTAGAATATTPTAGVATVTFQGTAASRYDVAVWLNTLSGMKGYVGGTYTTSTEKVIGSAVYVDFTSSVTLTNAVLSGRFSNLNGS